MPQGQAPQGQGAGLEQAVSTTSELLRAQTQAFGQMDPGLGEAMSQVFDAYQQVVQQAMQAGGQQAAPQISPEAGAAQGAAPQRPQGV